MFTKESISIELKRISDSVPKLIKDNTLINQLKTPEMKLVFEKALEEPSISQEKKDKIKHMLDSGVFDRKSIVENTKVSKLRDDWVTREIKKSVKAGRLPTKKQLIKLGLDKYE